MDISIHDIVYHKSLRIATSNHKKTAQRKINKIIPLEIISYVQNAEKLFQNGYNLFTNDDKCRKTVDISVVFGYH